MRTKLFLIDITFIGINFWYYFSPTFITVIKTGTERCHSTTHILLRTWFTLNQVNNQIATSVQNPFSNVKRFTFIFILKSIGFLNSRTNWHVDLQGALLYEDDPHLILALTKGSLSDLGFLQPIIGRLSRKTLRCSLLGIKRMCASWRTFWKFLIGGR